MITTMLRHATKDEGVYQPGEKLEEVGSMSAREMVVEKLPQEEVE
jgi:hypothetical protein